MKKASRIVEAIHQNMGCSGGGVKFFVCLIRHSRPSDVVPDAQDSERT